MADTAQNKSLFPGRIVGDRYELSHRVGAGGMGEVWAGRHLQLDISVALKFPSFPSGLVDRERFAREARSLARVQSPHVVKVLDADVASAFPYLVMELLEGESLKSALEREEHFSLEEAVTLIKQAACGLSSIHGAGFLHRDVSPGNVFLVAPDREFGKRRARLLDFGMAKGDCDHHLTTTGVVVGSPAYMSPEQARAEALDARSDVWSLGAVFFRTITGREAFEGRSVTDVLLNICTGALPSARSIRPELPEQIDTIFERTFARNPDFRFPTAQDLIVALDGLVSGDAGSAAGPLLRSSQTQSVRANGVAPIAPKPKIQRLLAVALGMAAVVAALSVFASRQRVAGITSEPIAKTQPVENLKEAQLVELAPPSVPAPAPPSHAFNQPPAAAPGAPPQPRRSARARATNAAFSETGRPTVDPVFGLPEEASP